MGYNRRDYMEPYKLGATSNGLGSFAGAESLAASMSSLSVSTAGQGSSANNDTHAYNSNQSTNGSSPQDKSNLTRTTSSSSFNSGRANLNPNAEEFVPKAYKPATSVVSGNVWDSNKPPTLSVSGEKEIVGSRLDRTNSSNSNASDDEYRRFCRAQLPDDLLPDFEFGDFVESSEYEEAASLDVSGRSALPSNWTGVGNAENAVYEDRGNQNAVRTTSYSPPGVSGARYKGAEGSSSSAGPGLVRPYMPELRSPVQQLNANRERQQTWNDSNESGTSFNEWGLSDLTFPEDLSEVNDPVGVLALEFPGFASESLADIYYANGGDLALTMEMLTELELQNEGATAKQFQSPPSAAPPSPRDFPALTGLESISGSALPGRPTLGGESRSVPDFAAAVRKQAAAQQAAQLQFERNGGVDLSVGAVRGPGGGGFPRDSRVTYNERLEPYHLHGHDLQQPPQPTWLETGDSVANMYSGMREEARDHARVRNAYFDQARQAYLAGNKALAKELSAKGQWHNEQMKAAHSKASEAIFWQRNASAYVNSNSTTGQPRLLDLHGLHVGEAIPLLKRELAQLRFNVRSTRQREQVFICVGTGHHTKGSRTPSRLPAAVQRYLLEEEHLQFTEPQPGMLRIIIR